MYVAPSLCSTSFHAQAFQLGTLCMRRKITGLCPVCDQRHTPMLPSYVAPPLLFLISYSPFPILYPPSSGRPSFLATTMHRAPLQTTTAHVSHSPHFFFLTLTTLTISYAPPTYANQAHVSCLLFVSYPHL